MADLSNEDSQSLELPSLKAILQDDFIDAPAPVAWKGAPRLPEFLIRVKRDNDPRIQFRLRFVIPKKYPHHSPPTVSAEGPVQGISDSKFASLKKEIEQEAKAIHARSKGAPIIFDIYDFATGLLAQKAPPPVEIGSLANQMVIRAQEEDKRRKEELARHEALERKRREEENAALLEDLDAARQARERQQRRPRANSEDTEVAGFGTEHAVDAFPIETFPKNMEFNGVTFRSVRLYGKRRQDFLFATYDSDPICEDVNASLPIETYVVDFGNTTHYGTTAGRKELRTLDNELQSLVTVTKKSQNLLRILGAKLTLPGQRRPPGEVDIIGSTTTPRIVIVAEQAPTLSLWDVLDTLEESGSWMSEAKASDYLKQILSGIHALHSGQMVHRCINPRCIHLAPSPSPHSVQGLKLTTKLVKISKVSYYTQLVNLFRANPWSDVPFSELDLHVLPDGWLSHDVRVKDQPFAYTRQRDVHDVGVVFMQMLMGLNVLTYETPQIALLASGLSDFAKRTAQQMFQSSKKVSCLELLAQCRDVSFSSPVSPIESRRGTIPIPDPRTPVANSHHHNGTLSSSPEMSYFATQFQQQHAAQHQHQHHVISRWKEDFIQLAELGKGGFGSVIKARNKTDQNIYAVKKVRIRSADQRTQERTTREVSTLSRLHHRYIVRYFTAWTEDNNDESGNSSDTDGSSYPGSDETASTVDGFSTPSSASHSSISSAETELLFNRKRLEDMALPPLQSNFPSVNFEDADGSSSSSSDDDDGIDFAVSVSPAHSTPPETPRAATPAQKLSSILYIQMEFVENQTLKELIESGLPEDYAWKLFQQLVEALVYLADAKIIHRDIKLTNIFIDANGDCKIGDFGLATTSTTTAALEAPDSRNLIPQGVRDMTMDVGTMIYMPPEMLRSRQRLGPKKYHHKADLYSLGIVFFEMNYKFSTESERYKVVEGLRLLEVNFPSDWDPLRRNQQSIIKSLLQHNPDDRPSAQELAQSPLLPPKVGDEYFRDALQMIARPDSAHLPAVLDTLFTQPLTRSRRLLYNETQAQLPAHSSISFLVQEHLMMLFRLHGAVHVEIPTFVMDRWDKSATFIDRRGAVVSLPHNMLEFFARTAVLRNHRWIKRYYIGNTYEDNPVDGHPSASLTAVFDIVSKNTPQDPPASGAELLAVVQALFDRFPMLGEYRIYVTNSNIIDEVLTRVPAEHRPKVVEIFSSKNSTKQADIVRSSILKLNLPRSLVEELEVLGSTYEHAEEFLLKLEKIHKGLSDRYRVAVKEISATIAFARNAGLTASVIWHPLMVGGHATFNDGLFFEVRRYNKRGEGSLLASGGRYENAIRHWAPPKFDTESIMAYGMSIVMDKITSAAAAQQTAVGASLKKLEKTFGYWVPRRCDVYIVSYQPGHITERWELVSLLWRNNISADLLYESAAPVPGGSTRTFEAACEREGILFVVYTRHSKNDLKVKRVLDKTETEVSRGDLVNWLQQQLKEQKRLDVEAAGVSLLPAAVTVPVQSQPTKEPAVDCQLVVPSGDVKKKNKHNKQVQLERALAASERVRASINDGIPTLAIDVSAPLFDSLIQSNQWVHSDEYWKSTILPMFPPGQSSYAHQLRDAIMSRKNEGHEFLLLFSSRGPEEGGRIQLLRLT